MVKDTIGMLFVTAMVITFGTNAITDDYNIWSLMVRFGGWDWMPRMSGRWLACLLGGQARSQWPLWQRSARWLRCMSRVGD